MARFGCGCGLTFTSQVGLADHRRLVHTTVPLPRTDPGPRPPKPAAPTHQSLSHGTPEYRARAGAKSRESWARYTPEQRAARIAKIRAAQLARWQVIRAKHLTQNMVRDPAPVVEPASAPDSLDTARQAFMTAWAALIAAERADAVKTYSATLAVPAAQPVQEQPPRIVAGPAPEPKPEALLNLHRNLSLRNAMVIARTLGFAVRLNSAGEFEFSHPDAQRRERVSTKRHDCPRKLLTLLRQVARGKVPPAPTVGERK